MLFIFSIWAFSQGCYGNQNKKDNILLLLVDDWRPLVDEDIELPNIKKMAAKGVNFKNTFAQVSLW